MSELYKQIELPLIVDGENEEFRKNQVPLEVIFVFGGEGFIGGHLVRRLKEQGRYVISVDRKRHEYKKDGFANLTILSDLRDLNVVCALVEKYEPVEIYQLAADMGGAGFVFTGENDADIMTNSVLINVNTLAAISAYAPECKVFYSSSACMYPSHNQEDPKNPNCKEDSAYPANPDSEYGWEKLFSERLYLAYHRNHGTNVRIARFHNIFGPEGTWDGGREKAPAAICRKIADCTTGCHNELNTIEVWGDGEQTRSFLYVDECIDGIQELMKSEDFIGPVNIGSDEMVTINQLVSEVEGIAKHRVIVKHIPGPQGVRGRNSDNNLIWKELKWQPTQCLKNGLISTYEWIKQQTLDKIQLSKENTNKVENNEQ